VVVDQVQGGETGGEANSVNISASDNFLNSKDMDNAGTGAVGSPLLDINVETS
jgi:hypothetical protein